MVEAGYQYPAPVGGAVPQVYIQAVPGPLAFPQLHMVGGVGFQIIAVKLQIVDQISGQIPFLGVCRIFCGHDLLHLGGLGQHHKPVIVNVHRVPHQDRSLFTELFQAAALKNQLIQPSLLIPAAVVNGHGGIENIGNLHPGQHQAVPFQGHLANARAAFPGEHGRVLRQHQIEHIGIRPGIPVEQPNIPEVSFRLPAMELPLGKGLRQHGKAGLHVNQQRRLHIMIPLFIG